jgi:surfactin family lipopeptide synthetase A
MINKTNSENEFLNLPKPLLCLVEEYNQTEENISRITLHQLFEKQVKKHANHVAVDDGKASITYQELDIKSNQTAHFLKGKGYGRGSLVCVQANKCIDTIVNMIGILKSGAAYVPVDPSYPQERKELIVEKCQSNILLTPQFYYDNQINKYPFQSFEDNCFPQDNAYIIFTSGSTGQPKGVVITHEAAANTVIDVNHKLGVNQNDKIIGISSFSFDLSVYDIFGTLSAGATLVLVEDHRDTERMAQLLVEKEITIWNSVPAIMDLVVDKIEKKHVDRLIDENPGQVAQKSFEKYYWSPVTTWRVKDNKVYIKNQIFSGLSGETVQKLYFTTQKGVTIDELKQEFPDMLRQQFDKMVNILIRNRILVNAILPAEELFESQYSLFKNEWDDQILVNPQAYERYKHQQLTRKFLGETQNKVWLKEGTDSYPKYISQRRTFREFDQKRKIPSGIFVKLLSIFKQIKRDGEIHYYYACAGGLYPVDIYLFIKEDRIEDLQKGLYYYCPIDNSINLITEEDLTNEFHFYTNKSIFDSSAFTIFMVYNAGVSMPKYHGLGYYYALIDTGIMVGTLTQVASLLEIGLCSVGTVKTNIIKNYLNLSPDQLVVHTLELGLINKDLLDSDALLKINGASFINEENRKGLGKTTRDEKVKQSLRAVLLSGDKIPLNLPGKIKNYFPDTEIISLGGATEASIWSIYYPIHEVRTEWKTIPYGKPLANQRLYVLNYKQDFCPPGVQGEIYIGGRGLAREYLNDFEKTNASFINHPKLGRLYKTGDYGVFHKEGYIEFLGRKDMQIKFKGYRVELGEIESCLLGYVGIGKVVVFMRETDFHEQYLCAFYTAEQKIDKKELRSFLVTKLPHYMVPSQFVQIEQMPLSPNGKINRKALWEYKDNFSISVKEVVPPRNEIEAILVEIWKEVLGVEHIGVKDDFFSIGGNSLKLLELLNRVNKISTLGVTDIPLEKFFRFSNIADFAENVFQGNLKPNIKNSEETV